MNKFALPVVLGFLAFVRADTLTEGSFECKFQGRFSDPYDCGHYFECIPIDFGSLKAYRRSCYGKAFNPRTQFCTDPSKVEGCKVRESRHYSPSTRYSELCSNKTIKYACADCETLLWCSEGKAYVTKCEDNLRCNSGREIFNGAVCYPQDDGNCSCRGRNTYYQDPFYNGTFFFCEEEDSIPKFFNCPLGMYFDEEKKSCKNEDGLPACTGWGIFTYPEDCSKYYTCSYAIEGWIQSRLECPEDMLLNIETGNCENPCDWASSKFKCAEEGRFPNPKDCNQFYECVESLKGEILKMKRSCPPNYHWNEQAQTCVKSENSKCKPETEGPLEHCKMNYEALCGDPFGVTNSI